jgi:hypothetical protein
MDVSSIIGIVATVVVAGLIEFFAFRRRISEENERQKRAKGETTKLLKRMLQGTEHPQAEVAEILVKSKFRECGVKAANLTDRLPDIIDGIVKELYENEYAPETERNRIIERATTLKLELGDRILRLEEAMQQMRQVTLPTIFVNVWLTFFGGLVGAMIVFLAALTILARLNELNTLTASNLYQFLVAALILAIEATALEFLRLRNRRIEASQNLAASLEDALIRIVKRVEPGSEIEREAQLEIEGSLLRAELVIDARGQRLVVGVNIGRIRRNDLDSLSGIMKAFGAKRSLLITHSRASRSIHEASESLGVFILDGITEDSIIMSRLKHVKLFSSI